MSDVMMFERLFQWDGWANERLLGALQAIAASGQRVPQKAVDRMAHLCRAQELWLSRMGAGEWQDGRSLFPEGADLKEVAREAKLLAARWAQFFRVLSPAALGENIVYTTTEGQPFESRLEDILLQLTHHGSYHRGQVCVDLKHAGVRPPEGVSLATDFIFFARTQPV